MEPKALRLAPEAMKPLAKHYGLCIASDMIVVAGRPVGFMYRQLKPDNDMDSGWRFLAGTEDQPYMDDPGNHGVYDVNTIANYDPDIIPFLDAPPGSEFERLPDGGGLRPVDDRPA